MSDKTQAEHTSPLIPNRRHEGGHRLLSLRREADPSLVMTDTSGRPITNERVNEWRATVEPEIEGSIAARFAREARAHNEFDGDDGFGRRIGYPSRGVA